MDDYILERFQEGIDKFNAGLFYECHDILEDVWFEIRGTSRRFYQGLIHLAVGFYHMQVRNNSKGALSQLSKGTEKLSSYKPEFQGVDIDILLTQIYGCMKIINEIQSGTIETLDSAQIPKINFNRKQFISQ